jgi:glyoxylase-like metal-dependent hydrolase (beta-lactamase superfamily II)
MAAPELVALSERVHLLPGAVNVVLVVEPGARPRRAIAIDSGQGKEGGRRLRRAAEALGVELVALVTTHAHADHFGGHAYLLRQRRLPVAAPPLEAEMMRAPALEPIYLFHGAAPPAELRTSWLQAEPSPVDHVVDAGMLEIEGFTLTLHDVSGHAHRQLAVEIDDVLVAADAVFGPEVLAKYPIPFGQDAARQGAAAAWVGDHPARVAVPGHGAPGRPADLADATVAALERVRSAVMDAADGVDGGEVLARVAAALDVPDPDLARWHLNHTTVHAHLAALRTAGRLDAQLEGHRLLWVTR